MHRARSQDRSGRVLRRACGTHEGEASDVKNGGHYNKRRGRIEAKRSTRHLNLIFRVLEEGGRVARDKSNKDRFGHHRGWKVVTTQQGAIPLSGRLVYEEGVEGGFSDVQRFRRSESFDFDLSLL